MRLVVCLFFFFCSLSTFSQTFPCDGDLLLSTNSSGGFTTLYRIEFGPFGVIFYNQVSQYSGGNFNALGFNVKDNYLYAVKANSNEIVRLKSNSSFEVIGEMPDLDILTTTAGACTADGFYLVHDQVLDQILVFDVVNNFALVNQIDLFWDTNSQNSGPFTARIDDFAIDPTNTTVAYSFQGNYFDSDLAPDATRGYLLSINLDFQSPDLGKVTPIASVSTDIARKIGSLKFLRDGSLFGYGSTSGDANSSQNELLSIDKFSGAITKSINTGPGAVFPDGCSCPYNLSFSNLADPNFAPCTDSELSYFLTISNQTFYDIPNASVIDTLPEGMLISNITGNFDGNLAVGTGIGTRILRIDNLEIASKSEIIIELKTSIVDLPTGLISNQAVLTNLPNNFSHDVFSDDPSNPSMNVPTTIFSDNEVLDEFEIRITNPMDCMGFYEGSVRIASPVFIPNIEYEVKLRNEEYEEFSQNVWIDEQNSFVIDSLLPGEYTFYGIAPINSRCSFAMKDTTVTIVGPNNLIQAAITTNAPICAGENLALSATVFPPEGTIEWTGPRGFQSTDLNIVLDTATSAQSGIYEMVFSYGVCEQIREMEIIVNPDIEAEINSQDGYCERDTMRLIAEGKGNLQTFIWTNPDGRQFRDTMIEIPVVSLEQEGLYELVLDNGACQDTVRKFISLLPTPTLTLAKEEQSKFCQPLVLNPVLTGDVNVSYDWQPSEGLSCTDCPNPSIEKPTNYYYQLQVENEFECRDSADIFVFLEQEDLIYLPNVFSPNGDGTNDYFQIFPSCGVMEINRFQVFNRFGSMVYALESVQDVSNQNLFWDGNFKGRQANIGVYIWLIEVTLIDGTKKSLRGNVTLFR
ncbi:MAG: gliding motility-associated C-terminal domain-containing protein [Saprospiraceae bacterium]